MRTENKKTNIGIGFVTGRKNFKNVVRAYINNLKESNFPNRKQYAFHLFVAYDLKYAKTNLSDYHIIEEDILTAVDSALYIGRSLIENETRELMEKKALTLTEVQLLFGEGYAMKRNAVLYFALKNGMDNLIFLDDDEYPMANLRMGDGIMWKGQEILATHIQNLPYADMTYGYHCGYISPIPSMEFNHLFSENDFQLLIEAISNDAVSWGSVRKTMKDGGVTYADLQIIEDQKTNMIKESGGMKFISGANLGINLKTPNRLFPFYNPPGARGEDSFLSTCLSAYNVRRIPCYTFHDGFLAYPQLLSGVLPNRLKPADISRAENYRRFFKTIVGWMRYKPLLLLITRAGRYEAEIAGIKEKLDVALPKLCAYLGNTDFTVLRKELDFYDAHVYEHLQDFESTKQAWLKAVSFLAGK